MKTAADVWRRRFAGLGFRLMAVMGLALLPLAMLSYVQALQTARLSESRAASAIMGETLVAAAPLMAEIVKAQGKAATLAAAMPAIFRVEAKGQALACQQLMDDVVSAGIGRVSFAGYLRSDGRLTCGSDGAQRDFSTDPTIRQYFLDPVPRMMVSPNAAVSKTSVLLFVHPVRAADGGVQGAVLLSMPHAGFAQQRRSVHPGQPTLSLMTFDPDGTVLTASAGMEQAQALLPAGRDLARLAAAPNQSFVGVTSTGERRAFAAVALQPGALYLLGSWRADVLNDSVLDTQLPAFLFPALMWAASLLVVWFAAESQVLRHVRSLRDNITAFAGGVRKMKPLQMQDAALELRVVGQAYERMTEAVLRNEADLENTIHQKEVLMREVHHRVKNNLQLIASIMNMQLRGARSAEAKEVMRTVRERVISLATVHRELYQTSGLTDVRADELLPRIARDLLRIGAAPGRQFDLHTEVDDIRLTPDQAVPLALFLTEGMANAMKHAWGGAVPRSKVVLYLKRAAGGRARFSLSSGLAPQSDATGDARSLGSDGFGTQLLTAFATQLNGQISRGREGNLYVLGLEFPIRPLTEAEERAAPSQANEALDDWDEEVAPSDPD